VPDVGMTVNARLHVTAFGRGQQVVNQSKMAIDAGALRHPPIARLDSDRILKSPDREGERVKKSVIDFRHPLTDRIVGKMTIVADGHMVMAAMLPRIQVPLHDVAIRTRLGVIA